ncbi:MAG TPA: hypothetical protein DDW85_00670 [Porphyromonadaceae bacterium]|mgnify:CR=1 FL=1|nr:hypothetical protein [Porphyromonadaceae bacterium]
MAELDGIVLLLGKAKFAGKEIGLISEDGVEWGGNEPEYTEVTAAQTRSVVKKVLKKAATIDMKFRLIELKVQNLVDTVGGTADANKSKWNAPAVPILKEGIFEVEAVTGQVVTVQKATLSTNISGTIGSDDPLGVDCTVSMVSDGKTSPYSIDNTAVAAG